ncbi:MAG: signal peptidase II [Phycisphaerae bacterium]|nr:signal peptidase II [Phycisphaerae bacterium]
MAGAADEKDRLTAQPDAGKMKLAWRSAAAVVLFLAITAISLVADLWSKQAVFSSLLADPNVPIRTRAILLARGPDLEPRDVLKALDLHHKVGAGLRLSLSTNPGVVFGLPMPPTLVAVATVVTILLVGWFFAVSPAGARWTHAALGLILAGALGNFYDRMIAAVWIPNLPTPITLQVRDFLDLSEVHVLGLNYPYIFNVADVWLVIGVGILLLHWVFAGRGGKERSPAKK